MILEIILYTLLHKDMGWYSLKEIGTETFGINMMNVEFNTPYMKQLFSTPQIREVNLAPKYPQNVRIFPLTTRRGWGFYPLPLILSRLQFFYGNWRPHILIFLLTNIVGCDLMTSSCFSISTISSTQYRLPKYHTTSKCISISEDIQLPDASFTSHVVIFLPNVCSKIVKKIGVFVNPSDPNGTYFEPSLLLLILKNFPLSSFQVQSQWLCETKKYPGIVGSSNANNFAEISINSRMFLLSFFLLPSAHHQL